jgi:murein L,D-transpeptidase YcbB/YkuD
MVAVTDEPGATAAPDPAASAAAAPAPDDAGPARAPAADALRASVRHAQAREQALADARSELLDRFARGQEAFARLLREAYAARGEALLFHGDEAQRTQRDGVLALLRRLGDEAVPTKPYRLKRIAALVDEVERRAAAARALDGCDGMGATTAALCAAVTSAKAIPSAAEATERLRVDGLERVDPRLLGFVDEHLARRLELRRRWLEAEAELDVLLLRAFFQYVIDFRLVKRAHPDNVTRHPDEAPGDHREVLLAHLGKAGADPAGHLRSLRPALPLYERTVAALKRYRALVAAGGAPKLSRAKMKPGGRGESVTALKKRLALEGYYDGPVDDRYDRRLEDAVSAYQRLHGMKETGKVDTELYKSLEIPMERRVRSIELSLQRYRESEVRAGAELLIRVNIPQYEAEFWEGDRIVRRHRVIVGTTALDRNLQAGIEGKLNHTRMFSAEMATVVLNPYWAVPLRIKKYELDRELIKNPNYYQDNNFEVTELPNGEVMVKQGPGPGNALGRVKFLFPNEHAIYMHDTPKRHLFDRTFRAFSHGCIRTHEPIELAKWLLKRQNGWSPERVDQVLATKKERQVQLGRPVPITIEYNTVSVDEEGRVAFYDDVYGYDRAYWDGELPFVRSTKIAPEKLAKLHEQEEKWRSDLATRLAEPSDDPEGPTPPPPPGDGAGGGQPGDDGAGADDADQDGPAPKSLNEALGDRPPPKKKGAR